MKTIISAVFFLLACGFTASAQETKKGPQTETNKEACCADHKNASKDEAAKCCAKASSDAKQEGKAETSCAATHAKTDGACCAKNPPKKE